jgi:hypothetical protein
MQKVCHQSEAGEREKEQPITGAQVFRNSSQTVLSNQFAFRSKSLMMGRDNFPRLILKV